MRSRGKVHVAFGALAGAILVSLYAAPAFAQDSGNNEQPQQLQSIEVTGSRIKQTEIETQSPVLVIDRKAIERTGLQTVGDILQQLTASGKALNAKFNSSGNFGFPSDGGGIGAGSAQVDLRNLGSKRVLVLVDGIRWVNESSASGVSGAADLNTIPVSIIERIEVLEDGASAIYGSDAIAGVINIITRKKFDGAEVTGYFGRYSGFGGDTKQGSLTIGGGDEKLSAVVSASYFKQDSISSGKWWQSSMPVPYAGIGAGSSATPQGRFTFCDPRIGSTGVGTDPDSGDYGKPIGPYGFCDIAQENWYDLTLNNGTTTPVWNPADPSSGSYHDWSGASRFNFAPLNLLLTPNERKSIYTNISYAFNDTTRLHVRALYNNRTSENQAAPEPIFVGPYAGTGGIADTITISANNPYNPFGINLDPSSNFGWITKRPIEVGPRIFNQAVDTWYVNAGLDGEWNVGRGLTWDANVVHSENKADQTFYNGFNLSHLALGLGDPAVCAAVPNCVPIDLFGGQARPMTQKQIDWIRATQIDRSDQKLDLASFNVSGDLFNIISSRAVAFAAGAEYRRYFGSFDPDPLRQSGDSQDSQAAAVAAAYHVSEFYGEFNIPVLESLDLSAAGRYSDYSTFGGETTGKVGFRWQPSTDWLFRGSYSTGFRAPTIGELYGLTQFGATLTDPCGTTGSPGPAGPEFVAGCAAQGVSPSFEQANTQITTITGGNPNLKPEKSKSWQVGTVYSPSWADGLAGTQRLDFGVTWYNHRISNAIGARDIQSLLDACVASGGVNPVLCAPFTRTASGNLNPPNNQLTNLGTVKTDGADVKINWSSDEFSFGRLRGSLQGTWIHKYQEIDSFGQTAARQVGIETDNGAIPKWQINTQIGWTLADWDVNWNMRYIHGVQEHCSESAYANYDPAKGPVLPGCPSKTAMHHMPSALYHDVQVNWSNAIGVHNLSLGLGINNLFDRRAPVCYSCTLNGYDAGTYDLPGRFVYMQASYKF